MDYEKKYNEALERAKQFSEHPLQEDSANIVEYIFPELAESKDEKIRKLLIRLFNSNNPNEKFDDIDTQEIIAWLEKKKSLTDEEFKQGKEDVLWCIEQAKKVAKDENEMGTCWFAEKWLEKQGETYTKKDVDDAFVEGMAFAKKELEKQGEQRPIIEMKSPEESLGISSKEYNEIVNDCLYGESKPTDKVDGCQSDDGILEHKCEAAEKLIALAECLEMDGDCLFNGLSGNDYGKFLRELAKKIEQKPAWNEEDEEYANDLENYFVEYSDLKHNVSNIINWLKSIKQRIKGE